jgi:hypothetical protein
VIAVSAGSLILAGSSGFMVAAAIGASPPPPVKTVTIDVGTGPQGPPGPPGPPGPAGNLACPTGFVVGDLVIDHPGGQVTTYGCLK